MIRSLVTMAWNQRKANLLMVLELTISFLVLLFVTTQIIHNLSNYLRPLGFDYENVWHISIGNKGMEWTEEEQIYQALREFPEIVSIGTTFPFPYAAGWTSNYAYNGKSFEAVNCLGGLELKEVLRIELKEGRWFNEEDTVSPITPVVINGTVAERIFQGEDAEGKIFTLQNPASMKEFRVIGVVERFRIQGEFSADAPFLLMPMEKNPNPYPVENFIVRVIPGSTAELEAEIVGAIRSIARRVNVRIDRLEDMRTSYLRNEAAPLLAGGVIAAFMLLMVVLGLSGVLWLNVSRRIKEIGLRRAKGATRKNIFNQMTGELLLLSAFGIAAGNVIGVQFRLFDFMALISPDVYIASAMVSSCVILMISYICGIYPGYLGAKVHPAEALRAE